jgi:hypothetical protein
MKEGEMGIEEEEEEGMARRRARHLLREGNQLIWGFFLLKTELTDLTSIIC